MLEFEVDYDHKEEERKQIAHWKRNSTGRAVRKKLRTILQIKEKADFKNEISLRKYFHTLHMIIRQ